MVKRDTVPKYTAGALLFLVFGLLYLVHTLMVAAPLEQDRAPLLFGAVAVALTLAIVALGMYLRGRRLKQREAARHAAAAAHREGREVALVVPQPAATTGAGWRLPVTIIAGPSWPRVLANSVLGLLVVQWAAFLVALQPGRAVLFALWLPTGGVVLILGPLIFASLFLSSYQQIEVSADGLTVIARRGGTRGNPHAPSIGWHEARLFALVEGGSHEDSAVCYELSGPTSIVRWVRVRRHMPYYPLFSPFCLEAATKPMEPFDAYDRQMEALLGLVVKNTGLPLYDLRERQ